LPLLSLTGIRTVLIVSGSYNRDLFLEFLELCLGSMNPFPEDNSVLVIDNCPIHGGADIREMVEAR
ncbi:hypothetical protein BDV93DRAFT_460564, partial [Ceratobasidium sp. AG-I]